ncbi:unnamed protein product, partial [Mesorhabditis spiculigera]
MDAGHDPRRFALDLLRTSTRSHFDAGSLRCQRTRLVDAPGGRGWSRCVNRFSRNRPGHAHPFRRNRPRWSQVKYVPGDSAAAAARSDVRENAASLRPPTPGPEYEASGCGKAAPVLRQAPRSKTLRESWNTLRNKVGERTRFFRPAVRCDGSRRAWTCCSHRSRLAEYTGYSC